MHTHKKKRKRKHIHHIHIVYSLVSTHAVVILLFPVVFYNVVYAKPNEVIIFSRENCLWQQKRAISSKLFLHQGIFISRVTENGPAAKAGLLVGDKLISVSVLLLVPIISRSVSWSVGRSVDLEPHSNLSYISTVSSTSFLQPGQRSWFVSCRTSRSCWGVEACRSRRHRRCRQRSSRRSGNSFISSRRQRQEQQRHHQ